MLRSLRSAALHLVVLGLFGWGAFEVVNRTGRSWFERDLELRASLVLRGASDPLSVRWKDKTRLAALLTGIARDERVMGVIACSNEWERVSASPAFPEEFPCRRLGTDTAPVRDGTLWAGVLPGHGGGRVHVSVSAVADDAGAPLGFVALLHDMQHVERREAAAKGFLILTFVVLAIASSGVALYLERLSFRTFVADLRGLVAGRLPGARDRFRPLLRDVQELVTTMTNEGEGDAGRWSPERLRRTLQLRLQGEKLVIVANREPYIHQKTDDGSVRVLHPASGLVTALEPVMRACSGVWVAHGSGSADRETADRHGHVRVPPGEESYTIRRVWLSPEEEKGYYYGFSNEGLWPLCHVAHTRPEFRAADWEQYRRVNERFADAVCEEVDAPDPIVLVQDYHFALAPRLLRERLPRATILAFWHIPWPNAEQFGICPWAKELVDGLLGSSIVGFHTQLHCNNFLDAVDRFLEARIDREAVGVVQQGRTTLVRPYPISIEWPNHWASESGATVQECRRRVLSELGLPADVRLGVGVDRLDYTKGIEERLLAVERMLDRSPHHRGKFVFVQIAAPSRTAIDAYRGLNERVEALAARINARFQNGGSWRPIVLLREHHEPPSVFRLYRAADLCYVSSLHDGMNLVAKEFVAARDDEDGVLLLSKFTGASRELTEALVVNPYDLEEASDALAAALEMSPDERRARMRALRGIVGEFNVYRWAGRMLSDAERLRRRDRLSDRLFPIRPAATVER